MTPSRLEKLGLFSSTAINPLHPKKAHSPIESRDEAIDTDVKKLVLVKAYCPISLTEPGMV